MKLFVQNLSFSTPLAALSVQFDLGLSPVLAIPQLRCRAGCGLPAKITCEFLQLRSEHLPVSRLSRYYYISVVLVKKCPAPGKSAHLKVMSWSCRPSQKMLRAPGETQRVVRPADAPVKQGKLRLRFRKQGLGDAKFLF